jgi:predicted HicB family RNase H-like nuclease
VIEYKGYFSTINRLADGDYVGVVVGLHTSGVEFHASSICLLRKKFEEIVDEFLQTASSKQATGMGHGELN